MGRQMKDQMDEEAAVMGHMTRSKRYLSDMFEQGTSMLANMAENRERIKVRPGRSAVMGKSRNAGAA